MKPSLTLRNVWRNKDLRTLFAARLISNLGNGLSPVAIAFGVLALPGATPTSLSIVMFCQLLPIVAFMLVGGIVADRFRNGSFDCHHQFALRYVKRFLVAGHGGLDARPRR